MRAVYHSNVIKFSSAMIALGSPLVTFVVLWKKRFRNESSFSIFFGFASWMVNYVTISIVVVCFLELGWKFNSFHVSPVFAVTTEIFRNALPFVFSQYMASNQLEGIKKHRRQLALHQAVFASAGFALAHLLITWVPLWSENVFVREGLVYYHPEDAYPLLLTTSVFAVSDFFFDFGASIIVFVESWNGESLLRRIVILCFHVISSACSSVAVAGPRIENTLLNFIVSFTPVVISCGVSFWSVSSLPEHSGME